MAAAVQFVVTQCGIEIGKALGSRQRQEGAPSACFAPPVGGSSLRRAGSADRDNQPAGDVAGAVRDSGGAAFQTKPEFRFRTAIRS